MTSNAPTSGPKPTIAQVQGKVIAGGLMLVWPCDLVVASEEATFADPVVAFGVNGHEYFVHTWELGHRKAKEMLFRGNALTAEECRARPDDVGRMVVDAIKANRLYIHTDDMMEGPINARTQRLLDALPSRMRQN